MFHLSQTDYDELALIRAALIHLELSESVPKDQLRLALGRIGHNLGGILLRTAEAGLPAVPADAAHTDDRVSVLYGTNPKLRMQIDELNTLLGSPNLNMELDEVEVRIRRSSKESNGN